MACQCNRSSHDKNNRFRQGVNRMSDRIIGAGNVVQSIISQKGVQALITLMVVGAVLTMMVLGREIPEWAMLMASGLVGLYFDVPGKQYSFDRES